MNRRLFLRIAVAIVAIASVLITTGVILAQSRGANGVDRALAAQAQHTRGLMAKPGVVGTAVGLGDDGNPAVLVLLEHGNVAGIPAQVDGVKVKKLVTGKIYALPKGGNGGGKPDGDEIDPTARWDRPVPIGVSTGHPLITAGTIGCRVTDGEKFYALSNNHVYAAQGQAQIGSAVIQPGRADGGTLPLDKIGTLAAFVGIDLVDVDNEVDAAIALLDDTVDVEGDTVPTVGNATPIDGYGSPESQTAAAFLEMEVLKYGRTTGQTTGEVTGINATVNVTYDSGLLTFKGQIIITGTRGKFSRGGDSGSLVVAADDLKPVGLLFAGGGPTTIANPIDLVLTKLGEEIGSTIWIDSE